MPGEDAPGPPGELSKHAPETRQVSKSAFCRGGDPAPAAPRAPLRAAPPLPSRRPADSRRSAPKRGRERGCKTGSVTPRAGDRARSSASTTV